MSNLQYMCLIGTTSPRSQTTSNVGSQTCYDQLTAALTLFIHVWPISSLHDLYPHCADTRPLCPGTGLRTLVVVMSLRLVLLLPNCLLVFYKSQDTWSLSLSGFLSLFKYIPHTMSQEYWGSDVNLWYRIGLRHFLCCSGSFHLCDEVRLNFAWWFTTARICHHLPKV